MRRKQNLIWLLAECNNENNRKQEKNSFILLCLFFSFFSFHKRTNRFTIRIYFFFFSYTHTENASYTQITTQSTLKMKREKIFESATTMYASLSIDSAGVDLKKKNTKRSDSKSCHLGGSVHRIDWKILWKEKKNESD